MFEFEALLCSFKKLFIIIWKAAGSPARSGSHPGGGFCRMGVRPVPSRPCLPAAPRQMREKKRGRLGKPPSRCGWTRRKESQSHPPREGPAGAGAERAARQGQGHTTPTHPPVPQLALGAADFMPLRLWVTGWALAGSRGDSAGRRRSRGGGQGSVTVPARVHPPTRPGGADPLGKGLSKRVWAGSCCRESRGSPQPRQG